MTHVLIEEHPEVCGTMPIETLRNWHALDTAKLQVLQIVAIIPFLLREHDRLLATASLYGKQIITLAGSKD